MNHPSTQCSGKDCEFYVYGQSKVAGKENSLVKTLKLFRKERISPHLDENNLNIEVIFS